MIHIRNEQEWLYSIKKLQSAHQLNRFYAVFLSSF